MLLKVEVKNEILGDSVFWGGTEKQIDTIRNLPARMLARKVAQDGKTRRSGMWIVSVVKQ